MAANRWATKIQYGKESTRGTAVAATKVLFAAPMAIDPDRKPVYYKDGTGLRVNAHNSKIYQRMVRNTLRFDSQHPLYFQALPMLFSCGIKGNVTATETTGGQGDYLWSHTPTLNASNAPDALTIEGGDDTQAFECEYSMFERYKISGQVSQDGGDAPVTAEADFFGRQWSPVSFTGSLALTTPTYMNSKLSRLYIDTAWASVGSTEKTNILRAFDIEILSGVHPKSFGSANEYFDSFGESDYELMLTFDLEGNSDADAIWDAYLAQTFQVLRFVINGPQIGTGTTYAMTLDVGGTWEYATPVSSEDRGNNITKAMFRSKYDATGAKLFQLSETVNSNAI